MQNQGKNKIGMGVIAALLLGGVSLFYYKKQRADLIDQNRNKLIKVEQNLMLFRLHNRRFPTSSEGLLALSKAPAGLATWKGPYLPEESLMDVWGQPLQYEMLDARKFKLKSAGPDGSFGSVDDVIYPKQ